MHVNNPYLKIFYSLPKIHKRFHAGLYYQIQTVLLRMFHSLISISNACKTLYERYERILKKALNLLPDNLIFQAIMVVGLYPNKPNEEWLIAIRKVLDTKEDRTILTVSLIKLTESALKLVSVNTMTLPLNTSDKLQLELKRHLLMLPFLGTALSSKRPVTDF